MCSVPWDAFSLACQVVPILKIKFKSDAPSNYWCKSCEKDPALASWAIFCEFSHHLLSGAAYCHSWGQDLGLWRDSVHACECCSLWLGWKGCALLPTSAWLSLEAASCVQVTLERGHHAQLCPAPPAPLCIRDGLIPCRGTCWEFMSLISPQLVHSEPLQVFTGKQQQQPENFALWFSHPCSFLKLLCGSYPGVLEFTAMVYSRYVAVALSGKWHLWSTDFILFFNHYYYCCFLLSMWVSVTKKM